ncbi:Na/Pi cotransporter family protein [Pusillimonas sp. TS35]|uniref:Na/Pi cotransporter family protein n=1 Tax=Paracandidimonas lactea TaxID=2895524 RepID=UPI00136CBFA5|nr:Na/Pi cotransporter family protein [Paracandidimonas lactea]MYN13807.1 Na/Pi cotransporter family protein [Pusillimonas sp. TS35]
MREIFALLNFGGYIALLLWGVHMVQTGVQRAFGAALHVWMGRALGTRAKAFFTGMGITAAVQSSTATGLMISSFAAGGLLALGPGLAAMLGANVGTTIIVQLLSFKLTALAPPLILLGVWLFRRNPPGRRRDLGRVFIGLGLLLLSLHELTLLFKPVEHAQLLRLLIEALSDQPVAAMALAAVLAWASHSSVAVVVLIMSLAHQGLIGASLAIALVLGANLGTAVNPLLETAGGNDPATRRLPIGNLGTRVAGCVIALITLPWLPAVMQWFTSDPARGVANFHTFFNIAVALIFLPLLTPYARLLRRLLPRRTDPNDPSQPRYLDASAHEVPGIALGNAAREALRISDMVQNMLSITRTAFTRDGHPLHIQARYLANAINQLDSHIAAYLATLDQESLNKTEHQRLDDIVAFSSNMTHAANIAANGLMTHIATLRKKGWSLKPWQQEQLAETIDRLIRNQRQAAALFMTEDLRSARVLAFEKGSFRELEAQAVEQHLRTIKAGRLDDVDQGSFYLDILRDTKAINACMVEATAYPILARHNALLPNRLRDIEPSDN